ncbi:MAG: hypothetical protein RI885_1851 [Actinomycetota bacterium]
MRGLPTWSKRRYAALWRDRAALDGDLIYVALGDSAAQGLGATAPTLGYVGLLADLAEKRTGRTVRVVNLSVSGAKVRDVVDGQLAASRALEADVVTCAVGGNDMRRFDAERFESDFRDLVAGLPGHALVADVPCFYSGRGEVASRAASGIVRRVLDDAGRIPVPLHSATEARTREQVRGDFALDFFHPNDRGYSVWAQAFQSTFLARIDQLSPS